MPGISPSTFVIKYRCTDPEISFGDLKIGGLMRKTSIVLHTPQDVRRNSVISQDNRRNSLRDSLRESRLSFLSGNGFEENNQVSFLSQRFVSSTGNIEILLSHLHSIVLRCPKSCQMAAHNLKIYISIFFS